MNDDKFEPRAKAGDILLWPDGSWCQFEDRGVLGWMNDDYEVVREGDPRYSALMNQ